MDRKLSSLLLAAAFLFLIGCGSEPRYPVHSHVEGQLRVSEAVDPTPDYRDFRVTVMTQTEGDVDTLGTAITDSAGVFAMEVHAPEEGIYPITVERGGQSLSLGEFVAVHGDTVRVTGTFPLGARSLRIVSPENSAWAAYRNTKAQHDREMLQAIQSGDQALLSQVIARTSSILWSSQDVYPGTYGADLAAAESIVMMEGWNDSLVVARGSQIRSDHPSIAQIARALRRSTARLSGQDAAVAALNDLLTRVEDPDQRAEILSELVLAHADSLETDRAVAAATELRRLYPDSRWAPWADRATYELENLMPGMQAPVFEVTTRTGETVSSSALDGSFYVLEFFNPAGQVFHRELSGRDALYSALEGELFQFVAISVEPDSVINEALFDGADHPGRFVWEPAGLESEIAKDYNVNVLPTRILVDPDGRIIAKYAGPALTDLQSDLVAIVGTLDDLATRNQPDM